MNERERNKHTQLGKSHTNKCERADTQVERCGNKNNDNNTQVRCAYNKNISVTCPQLVYCLNNIICCCVKRTDDKTEM